MTDEENQLEKVEEEVEEEVKEAEEGE